MAFFPYYKHWRKIIRHPATTGIFSNFIKNAFLEKINLLYASISRLLIFPNFEKFRIFILKTLNFGRKKAFLRKITILSACYIKFPAFDQFLKFSFFLKKTFRTLLRNLTISLAFYSKFATIWSLINFKFSNS